MKSHKLPELDAILQSMDAIDTQSKSRPKIWSPSLQTSLMSKYSNAPLVLGSPEIGSRVTMIPPHQQRDLFMQNYLNKDDGDKDFRTGMQIASLVHRKATEASNIVPSQHTCKVYPPLLVRYSGTSDQYIPVQLFMGAEMRRTTGFPDMIVNFHSDTQAITVTVCQIEPKKMQQYELAMQVLYSMVSDNPLTIEEFTSMYDLNRYNLTRSIAQRLTPTSK